MQVYAVGGCVRDALLGRPVADRDWVVVGATPQQMIEAGYRPVGRDFPVFLHPQTHEEHALARTERKTAPGYHGFAFHAAPEVTLEDDLARRDLTINAIAQAADGTLIDPYGGRQDLAARGDDLSAASIGPRAGRRRQRPGLRSSGRYGVGRPALWPSLVGGRQRGRRRSAAGLLHSQK